MYTEFVHRKNLEHLRRQLAEAKDQTTRETVQNLLDEEMERDGRFAAAKLRNGGRPPDR